MQFVNGHKAKEPKNIAREIENFSKTVQEALATYYSQEREGNAVSIDPQHSLHTENTSLSSSCTADMATAMFQESGSSNENSLSHISPINKKSRDLVIDKARRCLAWAHDPARPAVPGAEAMTNDQVF